MWYLFIDQIGGEAVQEEQRKNGVVGVVCGQGNRRSKQNGVLWAWFVMTSYEQARTCEEVKQLKVLKIFSSSALSLSGSLPLSLSLSL